MGPLASYPIVALVGLAIGSFLNVVIHRLPRDKKVWRGRSVCPRCERQLKWYHNVPVISYLLLRGRCSFCKEKIAVLYPIVELLNAAAYVYLFWQFGQTLDLLVYAYIFSALLTVIFIDIEFQIIPDLITLPGIILGLAVSLLPGGIGILVSSVGLLIGGGSLYLIAMLGDWLFKKDSMGGGDIKLAAMLGAFLGWQKVMFIFISSAFIGLAVSAVLMIFSKKLREKRLIPFGPFLAIAAMLAVIYGDQIIALYVDNFVGIR